MKHIDYVAKVKVPKNCYFCKHITDEYDEITHDSFPVCENKKSKNYILNDVKQEVFEKNMRYPKRCFEPTDYLTRTFSTFVKVKVI